METFYCLKWISMILYLNLEITIGGFSMFCSAVTAVSGQGLPWGAAPGAVPLTTTSCVPDWSSVCSRRTRKSSVPSIQRKWMERWACPVTVFLVLLDMFIYTFISIAHTVIYRNFINWQDFKIIIYSVLHIVIIGNKGTCNNGIMY